MNFFFNQTIIKKEMISTTRSEKWQIARQRTYFLNEMEQTFAERRMYQNQHQSVFITRTRNVQDLINTYQKDKQHILFIQIELQKYIVLNEMEGESNDFYDLEKEFELIDDDIRYKQFHCNKWNHLMIALYKQWDIYLQYYELKKQMNVISPNWEHIV